MREGGVGVEGRGSADGEVAFVVVRQTVKVVVGGLGEVLGEVERAEKALEHARLRSDASVRLAERRLERALGGIGLARWRALVSGRSSIRSHRDGREAAVAARRRPAVDEAVAALAAARAAAESRVAAAEEMLARAAKRLDAYGPLAWATMIETRSDEAQARCQWPGLSENFSSRRRLEAGTRPR